MNDNLQSFTICLNMIVKNESHIILDTLKHLCSKIKFDYWVICDTGSTDNTTDLIQDFFNDNKINGELHIDKWVDFGHNRTLALEKAFNKTDFLLIFDADDIIIGDFIFPENMFKFDSYYLKFKTGCEFYRMLIINNKKKWKFIGVLHECIECLEDNKITYLYGNYYIHNRKCGNRSNYDDKYIKDALILETAYEVALKNDDIIHTRYSFYCANSYKDAEDKSNAIKWYKNTLLLKNAWAQEKYLSCLNLYNLYESQQNIEQGIYYLIESYKYDKTRVECIYYLIKHYAFTHQFELTQLFYTLIQDYYENNYINDKFENKLFIHPEIYSFWLPYYMIIVSEKINKYDIGLKCYDIIFTKQNVNIDEVWIKHLVHNLQFFIKKNTDVQFVHKWRQYLTLINKKKYNIDTNLVNAYEIYNVSKYVETILQNNDTNSTETILCEDTNSLVVAILAKDKGPVLPFYLSCLYNQTYNKKHIHIYIRTNDNIDNTESLLSEFIDKYGKEYASVYVDNSSISENLKQYSNHEWNSFRFNILGKIRQDSVDYANKLKAHYFVADCDNFIIPTTIENLIKNRDIGVISPMLRAGFNENVKTTNTFCYNNIVYSNFHYEVTNSGYFQKNDAYHSILNNDIVGLFRVCCVHCTYLIPYKYLSQIKYNDGSNRYEYVIFSETLRKNNIPQYIDNSHKYGYLTFMDTKDDFELEYVYNKNLYQFIIEPEPIISQEENIIEDNKCQVVNV